MSTLSGKTLFITGASRGIGKAIGLRAARDGANIVLFSKTAEPHPKLPGTLYTAAEEMQEAGGKTLVCVGDIRHEEDVADAVQQAEETFGGLDILVNNAGIIDPIVRLEDSAPADWARAVDINVKGVYYGLRAVLPHMMSRGQGTIINLSSGAANSALEGWSHYCTTKAAVKKITECAHVELGASGIRVIGLSPGTVATDMMASIRKSGLNPVSQLDWDTHITPDWVARAIAYLCGPGGDAHCGTDFSIKTDEGRRAVGLL